LLDGATFLWILARRRLVIDPPHVPSRDIVLDVLSGAYPAALDDKTIREQSAYSGSNERLDCILRGLSRSGHIKPVLHKWRYVYRRAEHDKRCKKRRNEPLNVDFELSRLLDAVRQVMMSAAKTDKGVLIDSGFDWSRLETAMAYYKDHGYG